MITQLVILSAACLSRLALPNSWSVELARCLSCLMGPFCVRIPCKCRRCEQHGVQLISAHGQRRDCTRGESFCGLHELEVHNMIIETIDVQGGTDVCCCCRDYMLENILGSLHAMRADCCLQPFDKTMESADKVYVGADASNYAECSLAEVGKAASGHIEGSHTATVIAGTEAQQLKAARWGTASCSDDSLARSTPA